MRPPSTNTTFNAINHSRSACDRQAGKRNSWHFRTIKMYLSSSYMEKVNVYVTTEKRKNSQKPVKAMLSYKCSLQKPHRHCICLVLTNFCISKLLTNNLLILVNQKRFRKSEEQNTQQFRTYRQGQVRSVCTGRNVATANRASRFLCCRRVSLASNTSISDFSERQNFGCSITFQARNAQ